MNNKSRKQTMRKLKFKWEIGDGGRNGLRRALKKGNDSVWLELELDPENVRTYSGPRF
jgi:hypothetical protein